MKKIVLFVVAAFMLHMHAYAVDFTDPSQSEVILKNGEIYNTTAKEYSEAGTWETAGIGFDTGVMRVSGEKGAAAMWETRSNAGYCEVFYWNAAVENGDKNANINVFCTGNSMGDTKIDFSTGISRWESLGVYNASDGTLNITVSGSGQGIIAATAYRIVPLTSEEYTKRSQTADNVLVCKIDGKTALLNGQRIDMDMGVPFIDNDRTMLPVRFISEKMGAKVDWIEDAQRVEIFIDGKDIKFHINQTEYSVNGESYVLEAGARIADGRTYIPVKALASAIGRKVYWVGASRVVIIADKEIEEDEIGRLADQLL